MFVDGSKKGKEYKEQPKFFEGCASVEEAEFLADLADSKNPEAFVVASTYSGKKEALAKFSSENAKKYIKLVESAEIESQKKSTIDGIAALSSEDIETLSATESAISTPDHTVSELSEKISSLLSEDLFEKIIGREGKFTDIEHTKVFGFIEQIKQGFVSSIEKEYKSKMIQYSSKPAMMREILATYGSNRVIFENELDACFAELMAKIKESKARDLSIKQKENADLSAEIEKLTAEAAALRENAESKRAAIAAIRRESQKRGYTVQVDPTTVGLLGEVFKLKKDIESENEINAEKTADRDEAALLCTALQEIVLELDATQVLEMFEFMNKNGIFMIPEKELEAFKKDGTIPPSFRIGVKEGSKGRAKGQIAELIKKKKEEILAREAEIEAEPGK